MINLSYGEAISIPDYYDRLSYLLLHGKVSELTFGNNRYINQRLYHDPYWRGFRRDIIIRDKSCDLAHHDHELMSNVYVHHINPITLDDVVNRRPCVFDPDNVICVSFDTHQRIHYGIESTKEDLNMLYGIANRKPNDTVPWR